MARFFGVLGACYGFLWVALSALGAHWWQLTGQNATRMDTALRMLAVHALVLIMLCGQQQQKAMPMRVLAGIAFAGGTAIFSGALFALALNALIWLGKLAPFGGSLLMLGWLLWACSLLVKPR